MQLSFEEHWCDVWFGIKFHDFIYVNGTASPLVKMHVNMNLHVEYQPYGPKLALYPCTLIKVYCM